MLPGGICRAQYQRSLWHLRPARGIACNWPHIAACLPRFRIACIHAGQARCRRLRVESKNNFELATYVIASQDWGMRVILPPQLWAGQSGGNGDVALCPLFCQKKGQSATSPFPPKNDRLTSEQ